MRDQLLGRKPKDYDYVFPADSSKSKSFEAMQDKLFLAGWQAVADFTWCGGGLMSFLACRDLTINSMAISSSGSLWDTCGWGERDLKYGVLRSMAPEMSMFARDPIRVLRVLRMELTYSFSQTKSLSRTYKDEAHKLVYLLQSESPERRRQESVKLLGSASPAKVFKLLSRLDDRLVKLFCNLLVERSSLHLSSSAGLSPSLTQS